jgi:hypothetical protein
MLEIDLLPLIVAAQISGGWQGWARSQNRDKKAIRYDKIQFDTI